MEVSRNRTRKPKRKLVTDVPEGILSSGTICLGRIGNIELLLMWSGVLDIKGDVGNCLWCVLSVKFLSAVGTDLE